ncbi:hypothetical protein A5683_25315 [Mycobacterium mantenii]|uniref:Uncharacterized protein n=1 Tax=Mycobacterium mantenii TaxID=560555 RepID=A0A1A2T9T6_MYCNT|nr:hypothetical protein A5688_03060 [Mycobacterium mantenii]OBH73141.1 hypothetical protein A5683_25315 [Mycobacterium mantenii]
MAGIADAGASVRVHAEMGARGTSERGSSSRCEKEEEGQCRRLDKHDPSEPQRQCHDLFEIS